GAGAPRQWRGERWGCASGPAAGGGAPPLARRLPATAFGDVTLPTADQHLAQDPVLRHLIEDFGGSLPLEHDSKGRPAELYGALLRSITGQQLSTKAARAIYGPLTERFRGRAPPPEELLAAHPGQLRAAPRPSTV